MEILLALLLTASTWEVLPNRTVLMDGKYYSIREISLCDSMFFKKDDEIILKAGNYCYRIIKEGFYIDNEKVWPIKDKKQMVEVPKYYCAESCNSPKRFR